MTLPFSRAPPWCFTAAMQTASGAPLSTPSSFSSTHSASPRHVVFRPQWHGPAKPFAHTWEGIINVDQFRWMVRRDVQEQLELARDELGARHVRAVGMFDDEMRVFCPSPGSFMGYEPKHPRTNWQIVDYVMDSLRDRGLEPMFTTSFVPSAMASGPVTVFSTRGHTSPPRDWKQWAALVREAAAHAVDRYSLEVVRKWYFEVWNEPNLEGWFWGGNRQDYFRLWQVTYEALKSVDASLRVGGPSCARAEWVDELLAFGASHACTPDYLIGHIYNNDSPADKALAPFEGAQAEKNSTSPDAAIQTIRRLRQRVTAHGFTGELHWNEWGRSFHGIDARRETPNEAAFIARLLDAVSQEADAFAYWCLSDIYDQVGYGREAFHGGYGLLSLQGLRKPAYHAFELLGRLGTARVDVSAEGADPFCNAIVTAPQAGRACALVYAYDHQEPAKPSPLEVSIALPPRARPERVFQISSTENNVVARWRALGSPAYLSRAQSRELQADNALRPSSAKPRLLDGATGPIARFTMENPGVALLEIELDASA